MVEPTKTEVFISMAMREIENVITHIPSVGNHFLAKPAINMAKEYIQNDERVKKFIAGIVQDNETIDAGKEELQEILSDKLDDFSERLKRRLAKKE